jgi:hypothetical protein
MKGTLMYPLVVGVPGLCFLIAGAVNHEYPVAVLGGVMVIIFVYGLSRKRPAMVPTNDQKQQRLSFVLAGIIGVSLAINGFASSRYWLAAVGTALVTGSFLQLYRTRLSDRR